MTKASSIRRSIPTRITQRGDSTHKARPPGLTIVLLSLAILICIGAWMRLDRPAVRDRVEEPVNAFQLRIDLNRATEAELQLLPSIGPRLAERIVQDRDEHGPFASIDELARVRGIGPVTIERIAPYATADP